MIPMLPAKAVINVRPFLVSRLLADRDKAVKKDMERLPFLGEECICSEGLLSADCLAAAEAPSYGIVSPTISPSSSRTIREEYCSANSGLCVTIIINLLWEISLSRSIIWILVAVSRAPVGSSASRISGSLTSARAIATRCICPPDI